MTLVSAMITDLRHATAQSGTAADAIMLRAINAGIVASACIHRPPSLRTSGTLTASSGQKYVSLSTLSRWMTVDEVYNTSGSCKVWPLELSDLEVLPLPTTGSILYFAVHGNTLYYRPQPTENETLTVYYLAFPARMTATSDTLPLPEHEDFIFSFAQAFTWAGFEEDTASGLWQKIGDALSISHKEITQIREVLNRQVPNVYDIQAALPKGIPQA